MKATAFMVTPNMILNAHTKNAHTKTSKVIAETEQTAIAYAQWDRWTSYDMIKHDCHRCDIRIALKAMRNSLC